MYILKMFVTKRSLLRHFHPKLLSHQYGRPVLCPLRSTPLQQGRGPIHTTLPRAMWDQCHVDPANNSHIAPLQSCLRTKHAQYTADILTDSILIQLSVHLGPPSISTKSHTVHGTFRMLKTAAKQKYLNKDTGTAQKLSSRYRVHAS